MFGFGSCRGVTAAAWGEGLVSQPHGPPAPRTTKTHAAVFPEAKRPISQDRNHPRLLMGLQSLAGGETCLNSSTLRWQNLFHTEKTVESGRPWRQKRGQRDSQNGAMGGREAKKMGALQERKAESKEREVWGACRPGEPHTARLPKSLRDKPRSLAGPREPRPRSSAPHSLPPPAPSVKRCYHFVRVTGVHLGEGV